jgi:hypothetical protein
MGGQTGKTHLSSSNARSQKNRVYPYAVIDAFKKKNSGIKYLISGLLQIVGKSKGLSRV